MTLFEFCDVFGLDLKITRYGNQNNRWIAQIEYAGVKDGAVLTGDYGTGNNPDAAVRDYLDKIRDKQLVVHAMSKEYRKEFNVPDLEFSTCSSSN